MSRQTQRDRQMIKTELSQSFDRWNKMTDKELRIEVEKRFQLLRGVPESRLSADSSYRGQMLKYLVMDHLNKID